MADVARNAVYPFAEVYTVATSGTAAVDVWDIPAGTIITSVLAKIKTAGSASSGTSSITVGDDDTASGFITAADGTASADTVYGDAPSERGVYLYDGTIRGGYVKFYTAAGTELKLTNSVVAAAETTVDIFVMGYRYNET